MRPTMRRVATANKMDLINSIERLSTDSDAKQCR